jgi:hypothetical protein
MPLRSLIPQSEEATSAHLQVGLAGVLSLECGAHLFFPDGRAGRRLLLASRQAGGKGGHARRRPSGGRARPARCPTKERQRDMRSRATGDNLHGGRAHQLLMCMRAEEQVDAALLRAGGTAQRARLAASEALATSFVGRHRSDELLAVEWGPEFQSARSRSRRARVGRLKVRVESAVETVGEGKVTAVDEGAAAREHDQLTRARLRKGRGDSAGE